jgi:hypothetical protein
MQKTDRNLESYIHKELAVYERFLTTTSCSITYMVLQTSSGGTISAVLPSPGSTTESGKNEAGRVVGLALRNSEHI